MKTLLLASLLLTFNAHASCNGLDCYDALHLTYEEYVAKHGSAVVEPSELTERDVQIMKYQLMGLSDTEIEHELQEFEAKKTPSAKTGG